MIFIDHRSYSQYANKKKAQRLTWTRSWRRAHKKVKSDRMTAKKLVKKVTKSFKTFSGISLEELQSRSAVNSDYKKALKEAAERKAKAAKAAAGAKKTEKKAQKPVQAKEVIRMPKVTRARIQAAARK